MSISFFKISALLMAFILMNAPAEGPMKIYDAPFVTFGNSDEATTTSIVSAGMSIVCPKPGSQNVIVFAGVPSAINDIVIHILEQYQKHPTSLALLLQTLSVLFEAHKHDLSGFISALDRINIKRSTL